MRSCLPFVLCLLINYFAVSSSDIFLSGPRRNSCVIGSSVTSTDVAPGGPGRSLLSDTKKSDTALVAALNGTIYLWELGSSKPLWSFSSGPQIYSSYQAPANSNHSSTIRNAGFIDCGVDWQLYFISKLGDKFKLEQRLDKYISSTPHILEDGGIVLGSMKTTAFLVDVKTGRLLNTYMPLDSKNTTKDLQHLKSDVLPLYITRTDYALTSFPPNSNEVLWNVTVAEFEAALVCKGVNNLVGGALVNSESFESSLPFNLPLPCQSKLPINRSRDDNLSGQSLSLLPGSKEDNGLPLHPNNTGKYLLTGPAALPSQPNNTVNSLDPGLVDHKSIFPQPSTPKSVSMSINQAGLIVIGVLCIGVLFYVVGVISKEKIDVNANGKTVPSKRKKGRKSGKGGDSSSEGDIKNTESQNSLWTNLSLPYSQFIDGRIIGKLFVSNKEIAKGSNGTIVLEGVYEGRPVAVKRLVRSHNDIAFQEIQNLIASDQHRNIVRWYGMEQDRDFVYISLERCLCSLNDLIQLHSPSIGNKTQNPNLGPEALTEHSVNFFPMNETMQDVQLWKGNGYPSPTLLKIMRDVVNGLVHLHDLGIIHRDLKPQNVLIIKDRSWCAKLSDMGISKRLVGDMSSLESHATGYGSSGWHAPEQLLHGRQTRAIDLFSLGCVLFYSISGGRHPFGDHLERDINITKNKFDLFLVKHIPEAVDLLTQLLDPKAEMRPKALEVLAHPLFWTVDTRLSFLRDMSDRVELEDREVGSDILKALESIAPVALGGKWNEKMDAAFLRNIGHYRRYKFDSVRDLLRVIRNKLNHYRELPTEIQEILGPVPEGFDGYFRSRYPKLLIEVYKVMYKYCREEQYFLKYFKGIDYSF